MCKYCCGKRISVGCYDNMGGIKEGKDRVISSSNLMMKGNCLFLSGHGHYISEADDYYESWGVECDGVSSVEMEPELIKINYCPFCGQKLESNVFEKEKVKQLLPVLNEELKKCTESLNLLYMYIRINKAINIDTNEILYVYEWMVPTEEAVTGFFFVSDTRKTKPNYIDTIYGHFSEYTLDKDFETIISDNFYSLDGITRHYIGIPCKVNDEDIENIIKKHFQKDRRYIISALKTMNLLREGYSNKIKEIKEKINEINSINKYLDLYQDGN